MIITGTSFAIFESLKDENEETHPKLDSNWIPQKHHTIPADVLPNASEDLFNYQLQMTIFLTPAPAKYKIQWFCIIITVHGGLPVNILFLFRNVRNFDVRIQYTKCIQSEDKIGGKKFLIQSV